jgi:membrane associated rhomboid family serine protease
MPECVNHGVACSELVNFERASLDPWDKEDAVLDFSRQGRDGFQNGPMLNIPRVLIVLVGLFFCVHLVRHILPLDLERTLIFYMAFVPALLSYALEHGQLVASALGLASMLSYSLLHSDMMHLVMNSVWLVVFASPLTKLLGARRSLLFLLSGAFLGAFVHYVFHLESMVPVIGASAMVTAAMGALVRVGFHDAQYGVRQLRPIAAIGRDRFTLFFLGFWLLSEVVFGSGLLSFSPTSSHVAWQAHIGGFVAGFFMIGVLLRR